ncbi:MAG: substrate-binding domain-containing protein [Verrucomicrobia bacterium]|nr:substrate-binding domain-containing protein [Verrucomicrobiota bacterium]
MKKIHRRTFTRAGLGMMIPLGISCGPGERGSANGDVTVKIAVLFDSRRDPFRNSQSYLLQKLVQSRAATEFLIWDAGGDEQVQTKNLAAALAVSPDFIFLFPVNLAALTPMLLQPGKSASRIFIFADLESKNPSHTIMVCPDTEIGRVAGEFVIRSLQLKAAEEGQTVPAGRIVELTIAPPDTSHGGYSEGFIKSISNQSGITLVHQAPCKMLGEDVADRLKEALRLQGSFDVIFAHNDLIAAAASKAIAVAQPELVGRILVLGVDGNLGKGGGKEKIINGEIDATIYRPPLVDLAWSIAEKCLADPRFIPKSRYEVKPVALNFEAAIEVSKTGIPAPSVE